MSEYTSTREGFQRAMQWSLNPGPPEDAKAYVHAITTPNFYQLFNGRRIEGDTFLKGIVEWRGKSTEYKPLVKEFLRDGDQLAARMTGTITVQGVVTAFESFMFATIDKESGKMATLTERSVYGSADKAEWEHGVN